MKYVGNFTVLSTLFGVCTIYIYTPKIYNLNDVYLSYDDDRR